MKRKTLIAMLAAMLSLALCMFGVACGIADDDVSSSSTDEHVHSLTAISANEATCTTAGNTAYWTCECGKLFADAEATTETTLEAVTVAALGHNFGDWVTVPATCLVAGSKTRTCSRCDKTETEVISAPGHTYGAWVEKTAATCTMEGEEERECSSCHDKETRAIAALNHSYESVDAVAATYYKAGVAAHYKCSRCDELFVKNGEAYTATTLADLAIAKKTLIEETTAGGTPAEGDYINSVVNSKLKNLDQTAVTYVTTKKDGKDVVAAYFSNLNTVTWSDAADRVDDGNNNWGFGEFRIALSGNITAISFDYRLVNTGKGTCLVKPDNDGNPDKSFGMSHVIEYKFKLNGTTETYTNESKAVYGKEFLNADGEWHTFTLEVAKEDMMNILLKIYHFTGEMLVTNYRINEAHVHAYGEWTTKVEATCTTDGSRERVCACGDKQTETINKLGHDVVNHEAKAATCTEVGWNAYETCSRCDYTTKVEIAAKGHTKVIDSAVPATCTETGLKEGSHCSVCNTVLQAQDVVPALGHEYQAVAEKPATYYEAGVAAHYKCSRCEELFVKNGEVYTGTTLADLAIAKLDSWIDGCTIATEPEGLLHIETGKVKQMTYSGVYNVDGKVAYYFSNTPAGIDAETRFVTEGTDTTKKIYPTYVFDQKNVRKFAFDYKIKNSCTNGVKDRPAVQYITQILGSDGSYDILTFEPVFNEWGHYEYTLTDDQVKKFSGFIVKMGGLDGEMLIANVQTTMATMVDGCETAAEPEGLLHVEDGKTKAMTYVGTYNVNGKVAYYYKDNGPHYEVKNNAEVLVNPETRFVTDGTYTGSGERTYDNRRVKSFSFEYKVINADSTIITGDGANAPFFAQILASGSNHYLSLVFDAVNDGEWHTQTFEVPADKQTEFCGFILKMGVLNGEFMVANIQVEEAALNANSETTTEQEGFLSIESEKVKAIKYEGVYNVDGKAAYYYTGANKEKAETRFITEGTYTGNDRERVYNYHPEVVKISFNYIIRNSATPKELAEVLTGRTDKATTIVQVLEPGYTRNYEFVPVMDDKWHTYELTLNVEDRKLFAGFIIKFGAFTGEMLVADINVTTATMVDGCETAAEPENELHIETGKVKVMTFDGLYNVDGNAAYYFHDNGVHYDSLDNLLNPEVRFVTEGTDTTKKVDGKYIFAPQRVRSFSFDYKLINACSVGVADKPTVPYITQIIGDDGSYDVLDFTPTNDGTWAHYEYTLTDKQVEVFSGFIIKMGALNGEMLVANIHVEAISMVEGCEETAEAESLLKLEDGKTKKMTYNGVYNVDGKAAYYFSTGELDAWSETRFVTAGTNTKTKVNGSYIYAPQKITAFSFDYKIRNISKTIITDDGANAPYFSQIICSDTTYFPLELKMIADGQWHTQTYIVPEAQQELFSGFIVKLGRLKGEMFIANITAELDGAVAAVGNMQYLDLQAAFNAAKDGDTVRLLKDYTIPETVADTVEARLVINSKITLDFGAYRIIAPAKMDAYSNNFAALYVNDDVTFVAAENGGIYCESSETETGAYGVNILNGAKLTVNSGSYHGGGTVFQVQLGELEILSGRFSVTAFGEPYGYNFVINCIDSAYKAGTAKVSIKGGYFANFNPENCKAEGEGTNFVADGYTVDDLGDSVDYRYLVKSAG